MLGVLPFVTRARGMAGLRAALRGVGPAVIGMIALALAQMLPHAVPDVLTGLVAVVTVVAMLMWRLGPLPLMAAGGALGPVLRAGPRCWAG